jgi:hypothetical protein
MPVAVTVPLPLPAFAIVNKKVAAVGGAGGDAVVAHCSFEYEEVPAEL